MKEYIDREELLSLYEDDEYPTKDYCVPVPVIIQNIKDIPASNVVEVVRCRECVYYMQEWPDVTSSVYQCLCGLGWPGPDGYCYRGKRKES